MTEFAESYTREFLEKIQELNISNVKWHFVGQLQSNKVRQLVGHPISLFQSVDRQSLISELGRHFPNNDILIQVDTTGDLARGGAHFSQVENLVNTAKENSLNPIGIMLIARVGATESIEDFKLARKIQQDFGLSVLSAGMSDDFELAVGEGATMIRLGRVLFE